MVEINEGKGKGERKVFESLEKKQTLLKKEARRWYKETVNMSGTEG